jgi:protein ImuB
VRIACLYLPSFPIQIHVRMAPHLAGKAFAVVGEAEIDSGRRNPHAVIACSRAAWADGVRPRMTSAQARAIAPDTTFVTADVSLYRHALVAVAENLLGHSVTVDIGSQYESGSDKSPPPRAHCSIYLRLPPRRRAASWGEKLLADVARSGYRARLGIADDRFTAWAAAQTSRPSSLEHTDSSDRDDGPTASPFAQVCKVVARGGSAAYLAPLPIELLPLSAEVRQMLSTLGIHTLGEFAELPPPTVGRRWISEGVDYQKLAAGMGPTELVPFTPTDTIIEHLELEHPNTEIEPLSFMLRPLADRVCERLYGRGKALAAATLFLIGPDRDRVETELELRPARPTLSGRAVVDLIRAQLAEAQLEHPICALGLLVTESSSPEIEELDLFDYRDATRSPESVDVAVARLRAAFGDHAAGAAELIDSYRPEGAYRMAPFQAPCRTSKNKKKKKRRPSQKARTAALPEVMNGFTGALRLIDPPAPLPRGLRAVDHEGQSMPVVASRGPTRVEAEWWSGDPLERDYYEVETDSGGRYWVFRHLGSGRYYLHGIFD